MLNHIVVMGRFTKDPELKTTQGGTQVTTFTLAVERDFKGKNGEREVDFVNVVAWRGTAELLTNYFHKGNMVGVSGRLQTRSWKDKEGQSHSVSEIVAERVYFAESKRSETEPPQFSDLADDGDLPF